MTFFSFFFNTFQPRVNNKANKRFWLPGVLQGIDNPDTTVGGKLLPLKGQEWGLGTIKGDTGQTITLAILAAASPLEEPAMVAPCNPNDLDDDNNYATLSMNDGDILGLDNIFVYPEPSIHESAEGYNFTVELKFDAYDELAKLGIKGNYQLEQKIAIINAGETSIKTIVGTGTFSSEITNAKLQADIQIGIVGNGSNRKSDLTITQLRLVSAVEGGTPVFATKVLTINAEPGFEDIWLNISNSALNSPEASASMLQSLITTLNEPSNLQSLSQTVNQQLDDALNSLLGKAEQLPAQSNETLSNAADLYVFDRFRAAINDPNSNLYLPKQLQSISSPKIEPLTIDQIDIGEQKVAGLPWQPNILTQVRITGLANNLATEDNIHLKESLLTMLASQGALVTSSDRMVDGKEIPAPPLKIYADFSLSPPGGITPVTGTLTASISNSQFEILATAAGPMLDELVITLQGMALKVDLKAIAIDLNITSDSMMNSMANGLVNRDSVKQELVVQLNAQISNNLTSISQQVSESVVKYGTDALDN
ncbi:hypothetical protein [Moorena producens]|uniref:hypothetical protein n=1 Tax=Moorena producens TaxID=1155739 RepID=UPI003C722EA4